MKNLRTIFLNRILALVLTIVALMTGQSVWAQSKFTISAPTHNNSTHVTSFKVTRTTNTSTSEQVHYCTVSLSAIAGQHYTNKTGDLSFDAYHNELTVEVTETPDAIDEQYHFQTGTSRSYRLVIYDKNGFQLAYRDRNIDYGNTYLLSDSYVNKSITDLVYFQSGSVKSGSNNKYLDVAHSGTNGTEKMIDDGYDYNDNTLCTVSTNSLYNSSSALRTYLARSYNDYKMYATVYFQQREVNDGYQYIQILADNTTTYDGKDGDGKIDNGPTKSLYKAAFILTKNEDVCTSWKYQAFPHRTDDHTSSTEFDHSDSYLYAQAFKSNTPSYRSTTSGSLVLAPTVNDINVRFDANGGGDDTWYLKNLKVRLALVDTKAPTVLDNYKVSNIRNTLGANIYVSVPFSEIVKVTGTPKLNTTWGELSYCFGDGSNVLTFSGNISSDASGKFTVKSYSGTITDLAGNQLNTAGNTIYHEFNISLTSSSSYNITYDLAEGTVSVSNPTSYTYETATITLNNPTRFGYYFDGWTGSNGSTPQTTVTIAQHSHGNKSYTANWTQVWTGSGTPGEPYIINSTKGLDLLAQYVNSGNTCKDLYFQLGGNIEYTYNKDWEVASNENNYTCIGNDDHKFQGTFDGQGNTISGIRIYKVDYSYSDDFQGLFGNVGSGGTVKRVNLSDARITGRNSAGGIAGYTFGATIEDCTVGDDVCIHAVVNNASYHGGIVGHSQAGPVRRCVSRARLTVADGKTDCQDYGGIVGYNNHGTITDCIADGVVIPDVKGRGAITGYQNNNGTLTRNYYHDCKVASNSVTPSGVGMGTEGSTTTSDVDGAQPLWAVTLPTHASVVRTPATDPLPGTNNMTYDNGADINGVPYAKGLSVVNLSYDPATITEGYDVLLSVKKTSDNTAVTFTDNGDYTYTIASMPAADITVSTTEIPVIAYVDADGNPQSHACTPIVEGTTSYQTLGRTEGWYVVNSDVTFNNQTVKFLDQTVHVILCDGAHFSINSGEYSSLEVPNGSLEILAQSNGSGELVLRSSGGNALKVEMNKKRCIDINGGNIRIYDGTYGIFAVGGTVTIRRGTVSISGRNDGIWASNIILGCSNVNDRIYAKTYNGTVTIADGQILSDGTATYSGKLTSDEIAEIAGKRLSTAIPYIDADGTTKYKASKDLTFIATSTQTYGNAENAEGWYCVNSDVNFTYNVSFNDQMVNIILCDGVTLSCEKYSSYHLISANNGSLAIYGQPHGTGTLSINCTANGSAIFAYTNIDINGGTINASSLRGIGIKANNAITIRRGNITTKGSGYGFSASTVTLGCATTADRIYSTGYNGTVTISDGQTLTDGYSANTYANTLTDEQKDAITKKTMMKALGDVSYIDENGQEQICNNYKILSDGIYDLVSTIGESTQDTWYVASGNYTFNATYLETIGRVHIILCDGASFTVNGSGSYGIYATDNLSIYGQSQDTGTLTVNVADEKGRALYVDYGNLVVNGGVINANGGDYAIYLNNGSMTVNGGTFNCSANVRFVHVNGDMMMGSVLLAHHFPVADCTGTKRVKVTMNSIGIMSFSCLEDLDFTNVSGLSAYVALSDADGNGNITLTRTYKPAGSTGMVLCGEPSTTYVVPTINSNMQDYQNNRLHHVIDAMEIDKTDGYWTHYILAKKNGNVGFYPLSGKGTLKPYSAYLQLHIDPIKSRGLVLNFEEEGTPTGVGHTEITEGLARRPAGESQSTEMADAIYDLQGRRIEKPKKGLYIVNGKKVLVH